MKRFKVSAPGKLHLIGEHSVVYDKPAIIAAVDKRCFVEIKETKDRNVRIKSENLTSHSRMSSYAETIIREFANYYDIEAYGFSIKIKSQIPIGCGMGSSA